MITVGQVTFKKTADALASGSSIFSIAVLSCLCIALVAYSTATGAWIFMLKGLSLSKAYGVMSLTFIAVPLSGWLFLDEKISVQMLVGTAVIILGIIILWSE